MSIQGGMSQEKLEEIVFQSFMAEVNALKPGNVSRYSAGHDMTVENFSRSAELVTPLLCNKDFSFGERILESVRITMHTVGCNTNLGMVLLFTPIIMAFQNLTVFNINDLKTELKKLIKKVNLQDSALIFEAITIASPGGLGSAENYDVHSRPDCTLWQAMNEARNKDFIANQYVSGFPAIFHGAENILNKYHLRWKSVEWSVVACYLYFLSKEMDSHVFRKFGVTVAERIKKEAIKIAKQFNNYENPVEAKDLLLEFDRELKKSRINPGTTADITAACVLIFSIEKNFQIAGI